MRGSRQFAAIALGLAITLFPPACLHGQRHQHGLVLKSGDIQPADQWKVNGDRVRYHSTERGQWEEVPYAMIDWEATSKNNAAPSSAHPAPSSPEIEAYNQAMAEEEAARPTIAPGLRLPEGGGVLLLDTWRNQPELIELAQANGEINKQTGKNLLRAAINPLPMGSKQTIELKGVRARVEAHVPDPVFYINIDESNDPRASSDPNRFIIVRARPAKNGRTVANLDYSLLGKPSEKADAIPATATKVGGGAWIKVAPGAPLEPGQYALVERLNDKEIDMEVWDFGVRPGAPENHALYTLPQANAQPEQKKPKHKTQ